MKRHKRYPYIRRSNGKERGDSTQTNLALAMYDQLKGVGNYYVCIQRGCPNIALAVSSNKKELKDRLEWGRFKKFFRGSIVNKQNAKSALRRKGRI